MPRLGEPKHAPERAHVALLLIDVIHDFRCEDGAALHAEARPIATPLRRLRARAHAAGVPVVYVNDNFERWRSSFEQTVTRAVESPRGDVARQLRPTKRDLAVLKPGRSGFYASPLEPLLDQIGAHALVITGLATDQCVFATVNDAVLRKYRCFVPADCAAAISRARHQRALTVMREAFGVDVTASAELDLAALVGDR